MSINLVVAVTDGDWFDCLRAQPGIDEVNFWAPSGATFRALQPGELFLFKLHAPRDFIVGGGVFAHATLMPCSLAWQAFGERNGATSERAMRARIARYRRLGETGREDFSIGCRILTQPFFLEESEWLPVPASWSRNIVTLKRYTTAEADGRMLWEGVAERLVSADRPHVDLDPAARFGTPRRVTPRLGQGAFRSMVTDFYRRRCAVTQEKTLPALEAAHIRPYADGGPHEPQNGLLLRRDVHSLFDAGYVTVNVDLRFEVSRRIREEFENGRHYYELHGRPIDLPESSRNRPDVGALRWHNETVFRG